MARLPRRRRPQVEVRFDAAGIEALEPSRMVPRVGKRAILRVGLETHWWRDLYHEALTVGWSAFLAVAAVLYLLSNVIFAGLYMLQPGAIDGAKPGSFADAFFFSVQTMATIGYGRLLPGTLYANLVMTAETVYGMLTVALGTGLMFARFSRPTARVMFSRFAVIGVYDGRPTLSIRVANERRSRILQAEVNVSYLHDETTAEGTTMRRFTELKLARERTPIFDITFQTMHTIADESPLAGIDASRMAAEDGELLITVTGIDETMSQTISARYSYKHDEVRWGHWFEDIFGYTDDGREALDLRRFHLTRAL